MHKVGPVGGSVGAWVCAGVWAWARCLLFGCRLGYPVERIRNRSGTFVEA